MFYLIILLNYTRNSSVNSQNLSKKEYSTFLFNKIINLSEEIIENEEYRQPNSAKLEEAENIIAFLNSIGTSNFFEIETSLSLSKFMMKIHYFLKERFLVNYRFYFSEIHSIFLKNLENVFEEAYESDPIKFINLINNLENKYKEEINKK